MSLARRAGVCVLLGGLLATSFGCGRAHLFYDTRELRHEPLESGQRRSLIQTVTSRVSGRDITWVDAAGREQRISPDESGLNKLPLPELGALWLATSTGDRGGENDVRVRLGKRGSAPVTVLQDVDGNIVIRSGAGPAAAPGAPRVSEADIRSRFGVRKKMPGSWGDRDRGALADALAALSDRELELVRTLVFERRARSRDGSVTRAALYEQKGCRAVIYLFATGAQSDRYRFVGEPSAPRSAILHSLLHEMGHAIEQAGSRARYCDAERAPGNNARNRLIREGNRMQKTSPVLAAYMTALAGEPAPTDYGNTAPTESFAEAFALFHTDPAALLRTRPAVHAWFASGGHLAAQPGS